MVRRLHSSDTFDSLENEVIFTVAALEADERARPLLPETESWLPLIDAARAEDRKFRARDMKASARRSVTNARLDDVCVRFGKALLYDVGDRQSPVFTGFFPVSPSRFVRLPLDQQTIRVKGWLKNDHQSLTPFRDEITTATNDVDAALAEGAALSPARGANWDGRAKLAEDLTRMRSSVHRGLAEIAEAQGLGPEWPDAFFRVERESEPAPASGPTA